MNIFNFHKDTYSRITTIVPYILYLVLAYLSINFCFFFDTIQLSSLHAHYFYKNGISLLLPNHLDSGHPPLNGILLSILWRIFGKELWVGHVWMFFWVLLLIWQTQRLSRFFFDKKTAPFIVLVLLSDATILGQAVLVSPDIILMATFVWALVSILKEKPFETIFAISILSLISTRGMMITATLFLLQLFYHFRLQYTTKKIFIRTLSFAPGILLAASFLLYHYLQKGWIGYHADMPWSYCFEKITSFSEFFRNFLVLGLRLLDFGRFFVWILLLALVFFYIKTKKIKQAITYKEQGIVVLLVCLFIIFSYTVLFHKMLSGYRYLMPLYFLISLFAFILAAKQLNEKRLKVLAIVVSIFLFAGNFIPHPPKMSVGWDATLAHIPYYELREKALNYIDENNIPQKQIVTGFCLYGRQTYIDLKNNSSELYSYTKINTANYFLFSNVSNLEDEIVDELESENWKELKAFRKGNVEIILYQRIKP